MTNTKHKPSHKQSQINIGKENSKMTDIIHFKFRRKVKLNPTLKSRSIWLLLLLTSHSAAAQLSIYHGMRCMPDHQQRFLVNDFSETSNFYQYGWHRGSHLPSLPNTVHSNGRSLAMYLTNKPTSRFRWHVIEEPLNDGGNMDRNVEFAYAQAHLDRPMADSPMAAGMGNADNIGMQIAANGVKVPEVQSAHSAHYPYQPYPNNYRQGGNYGQNSNYGQGGGNYRRAGRNEPREQYSVMLFDESDDHILCADQYDEFHVTIEHINQPGKIEKFCVFRMRLYEDNYFTLELNQLDKRKIHSTQTHFLSVDFARVHMKQMTLYEASQRMDKSIEWRWSVGEENAEIANNNDNYQFMSVTQLPEPSCIHIRSPALSHRQRAHLHDQQLQRNREAQSQNREKLRARPEKISEDFRETEIVNDQPEELKKLSEVAAGLTTEPMQRIKTTTVIHRRAKYGSRKTRKRKRKRRRKKPKMPTDSIVEPDPPPKENDLDKMEVIHSNLDKKEKSLKNRLKKLKRIKQIEVVKGRHEGNKINAEHSRNAEIGNSFSAVNVETDKIGSTSNVFELLTSTNTTKPPKSSDSEHKVPKKRKTTKKRKKGRGRKKKKKNESSSKKTKSKPCPKKWEHQNGVCYRAFTRKRRSYRVADKYCGRKHAADLFTPDIENKEMAYFASWLAAKHLYNKKYRERMSRNTKDSTIRNREHFIWTGVTEKKRKNPSSKSVPVAQALTALISDQVKPIDKVSSPNLINKETTKLKRICTATKIGTTAMKPRSCKRKSGFICAKPAS